MDLASAGLREQPFRTHGKPRATIAYRAYDEALAMLVKTRQHPHGFALLQGPALSGKSTLIDAFVEIVPDDCSVAVVDGSGMSTQSLLEALLRQFGFDVDFDSTSELMAMLRVYTLQQASAHEPPVIIVDNAHAMNPSALRALCELAELKVRYASAVKFILASDRPLRPIVDSEDLQALGQRLVDDFHLRPMNCNETTTYVHQKLLAAGGDVPEFVFPVSVCNELWQASGGWPGVVDRIALLALSAAKTLPVDVTAVERPAVPSGTWGDGAIRQAHEHNAEPPGPPTLILTRNGKTVSSFIAEKSRLLVGRSKHNDLSIDSHFISRHHLLLVRSGRSTFLTDLNSTNGTFVNLRRVSTRVLADSDVISIGDHRIKFCDRHATRHDILDTEDFTDTVIMKTPKAMRGLLAHGNNEIASPRSENLPTLGN